MTTDPGHQATGPYSREDWMEDAQIHPRHPIHLSMLAAQIANEPLLTDDEVSRLVAYFRDEDEAIRVAEAP